MAVEAAPRKISGTELHKSTEDAILHKPIEFKDFIPISESQLESESGEEQIQVPRSRPTSFVLDNDKNMSRVTGEEVAEMDTEVAIAIARPTSRKNESPRKTGTLVEDKKTPTPQASVKPLQDASFKDVRVQMENSDFDSIQFVFAVTAPCKLKQEDRVLEEKNTCKSNPTGTSTLFTYQGSQFPIGNLTVVSVRKVELRRRVVSLARLLPIL